MRRLVSNQVFSDDRNAHIRDSSLFLSCCINHSILAPINRFGEQTRAHVTDDGLRCGHLFEGEVVELEAVRRLIVHIVEEVRVRVDIPAGRPDTSVANMIRTLDHNHLTVFRSLLRDSF